MFCAEAGIFVERVDPSLFARLSKLDDCAKFEGEPSAAALLNVEEGDDDADVAENDAGFGNEATVGNEGEAVV